MLFAACCYRVDNFMQNWDSATRLKGIMTSSICYCLIIVDDLSFEYENILQIFQNREIITIPKNPG